jgi:hypothetical protein
MWYRIKRFFNKIKRLFKWSVIIWKSETFDFSYSITIFKESLIELRDTLNKNNRFESTQYTVSKLNTIIKLIEMNYESDHYTDKFYDILYQKYGKEMFDLSFQKIENGNTYTIKSSYEFLEDKDLVESINKDLSETLKKIKEKEDKSKKLLWKMVDNYIEQFWD